MPPQEKYNMFSLILTMEYPWKSFACRALSFTFCLIVNQYKTAPQSNKGTGKKSSQEWSISNTSLIGQTILNSKGTRYLLKTTNNEEMCDLVSFLVIIDGELCLY